MPIEEVITNSVGFVIGDRTGGRGPIGTFFAVATQGRNFMVTPAHCVRGQNRPTARMADRNGDVHEWDQGQWLMGEALGLPPDTDLAIAGFRPGEKLGRDLVFTAAPIDVYGADVLGVLPKLGATVYFYGLLEPVKLLGRLGKPMVRTGSMGVRRVGDEVRWGPPSDPEAWSAPEVHLIDTRSLGGFSGSPCVMVETRPTSAQLEPLREQWEKDREGIEEDRGIEVPAGSQLHFLGILGMFVGYHRATALGVVIAMDVIRQGLRSHDVIAIYDDR